MKEFRNLVSSEDFSCEELLELMELGAEIYNNPEKFSEKCRGKILASLFFEPSTRTRLSFEAAMLRLGGSCITVPDPKVSSATKGESLQDTIKTVGCYSDIIAMRHPYEGSAELAKEVTLVPFINAGDGGHQHPTQTLTDLLTISQYKKSLENMTIGLCGDLKFGRTVHSLVKTLSKFKRNKFIFISPVELVIPEYIKMYLNDRNVEFIEVRTIEEVMDKLDILYMTRVQRERFFNEADYVRLKDTYILDNKKMKTAKDDMIILHPLPRVNEIATEVDSDPRAKYFNQVKFGMIIRMALILKLLEVK
ncbi:MAG: aspartate carbamoyltransferase [Parvimonas sp.]|uniref:aspartate carbamoyltransferase n=1 Tax=Parvimonas sp. TaxID=1944660 RepID=UPI001CB133B8|nr:aspartate carbamoyltransferase [Parvimonas sp.]MBF1295027.1 aspartate carbamoyltransferase [Parvimonas sp.]